MPKTKEAVVNIHVRLLLKQEMEAEYIKEQLAKFLVLLDMYLDRELLECGIQTQTPIIEKEVSISFPGSEEKDDNDDNGLLTQEV